MLNRSTGPRRRVTIRDVAAAAHVNPSTVSRILRNPDGADTPNRDRIVAVARELNYEPNLLARALNANIAPVVPFIIPDIGNSFFPAIARGAESAARRDGFALVLCNTNGDLELERAYFQSMTSLQVPFAVFAPASERSSVVIREFQDRCPIVAIDRVIDGLEVSSVAVDNILGARLVTEHLVSLGHRRIVCLEGPEDASTARLRVTGYLSAMKDRGLRPVVVAAGFGIDDGVRAGRDLLRLRPLPTAVVAANDLCALGTMHELQVNGVMVPKDVSVVGFDDLSIAACSWPSLTTVYQPAWEVGVAAVESAGQAMREGRAIHSVLRPHLVVRDSSTHPRSGSRRDQVLRKPVLLRGRDEGSSGDSAQGHA